MEHQNSNKTVCYVEASGGNGHSLRAVVSEFVLKAKLERYRRQIELTFRWIRKRYRRNRYSIEKKELEENTRVYVQFFLN